VVTSGLLAGGGPGEGIAASAFFSFGTRVILEGSDCGSPPDGGDASSITLQLAAGLGPGTYAYPFPPDAGSPFQLLYTFTSPFYGGEQTGAVSGSLTLTVVDPSLGVQGSYSFDFGDAVASGCNSQYGCGSLGDLLEEGTFVAPVCAICGMQPPFDACASPPFGDAGLAACDAYYAAQYTRCGGPTPPTSFKARFEQVCQNQATLPGSGMTIAALEACASALDISPCDEAPPPEACSFFGSLPGGSSCADSIQCQSGYCAGQQVETIDGPLTPLTCGSCAPGVVVLGPEAGAGAACDNGGCQAGLFCSPQASLCQPLEDAGARCCCQGVCAGPSVCDGTDGVNNTCLSLADGGACNEDLECSPGLGCILGECSPAVTWASAGQPCNQAVRCIFGGCSSMDSPPDGGWAGTCSTFIADGQPCAVDPFSPPPCDPFSECFEGTCMPIDNETCQ
jgi:hypothetical protein